VVGRGLWSVGVGYLTLALAAALIFAVLCLTRVGTTGEFLGNPETKVLTDPTLREVLVSSFAAFASISQRGRAARGLLRKSRRREFTSRGRSSATQ